jgi:histidinol-phosphatase (PHP family)
LKANYHTHLKLCGHAEGMSSDYVEVAIKEGFEIIGISDHGPIKPEFMTPEEFKYNWLERQMTYEDFLNIYLPDCYSTKEKYKEKIKVLVGVEIEYLYPFHEYYLKLREKLEYMNLAVHFYYHNDVITNSFDDVTYDNVYSYALNAKKAMETGLFEIMVHPDVYMYHYKSYDGSTKFDDQCEKTARLIIESAIKNNVYLEINVGGIFKVTSNNEVLGQFAYPRDEFWRIASEYKDLKVVVGIDAHKPEHLVENEIKMAYEFARKHNIIISEKVETIG